MSLRTWKNVVIHRRGIFVSARSFLGVGIWREKRRQSRRNSSLRHSKWRISRRNCIAANSRYFHRAAQRALCSPSPIDVALEQNLSRFASVFSRNALKCHAERQWAQKSGTSAAPLLFDYSLLSTQQLRGDDCQSCLLIHPIAFRFGRRQWIRFLRQIFAFCPV